MGSKEIKKLSIEALAVILISVIFLFGGKIVTSGQAHTRVQSGYSEMFSDVLPADTYQEIYPDNVYQAYDASGNPIGFVLDVTVDAAGDTTLHLLTGVTYDGAELTGIKHIHDEESPAPVSDTEIALIATQAVGNQIPVSLSAPSITDEDSDGTITMITGLHDGVYYADYQRVPDWRVEPLQKALQEDLYFIDEIGLKEHLSPTRSNGLVAMVKQMRVYALAYSTKH